MVDGSGALLLASPSYAKAHGLKPRARVVAMANMGDSPTLMLNAPVPAARKVLAKAGLTEDDIDLWEINEAFAVVAEKFIRDLKLDRDKVNVNGGSIALGHPIGATGSILIGTRARRTGAPRPEARPRHHVRRRRHGAGDHHRAGVRPLQEAKGARLTRVMASAGPARASFAPAVPRRAGHRHARRQIAFD